MPLGEYKDEGRGVWHSLKSAMGRLEGLLFDHKQDEGMRKRVEAVTEAYYTQTRPQASTGPVEAPDTGGWVEDVFPDHVIVHKGGKIWSVPYAEAEGKYVFDLGKAVEVRVEYTPVKGLPSFQIAKDAQGDLRWLGIASNNFRDRDNPPQIIEAKAHQEFEDYLDKGGAMPELWLWHSKGTRFGVADCVTFDNGFLVVSGTVDKGMEFVAENLAEEADLGMSHGFEYKYSDQSKEIIGWYRIKEVSVLPVAYAANPWTEFGLLEGGKDMNPAKRGFLDKVFGKDRVDALEKATGQMAQSLAGAGVESKEKKDDPPAVAAKAPDPQPAPKTDAAKAVPPEPSEAEKAAYKAMVEMVDAVKAMQGQVPELMKRIEALETGSKAQADATANQIKAMQADLKKSQDDLVAQAFTPRSAFAYVPSQATDNVVKEGDALQQAKPAVDAGFMKSIGIPGEPTK